MQQYLPFTVLKHTLADNNSAQEFVATVLTVYGIETNTITCFDGWHYNVATVLTVYGIETFPSFTITAVAPIATLQQYLPFTVLKQYVT